MLTRMIVLVVGLLLLGTGEAQKDVKMKEAIASRSKKLAEDSQTKTLAEMRRQESEAEEEIQSREKEAEETAMKEIRRQEAEAEDTLKAKTEQEEAIVERDLAKAKGGDNGPLDVMTIVAAQALQLAAVQRKLAVNEVEAQRRDKEMKQRLHETEGRLRETERRLEATQQRVKREQNNWKKTGLTLDHLKGRRQQGEDGLEIGSVKGKAPNGSLRQKEAVVKNKTVQANPVSQLIKWILESDNKIQNNAKKIQSTNNNVQNNANEIQDTKQKLQNNAQKIQSTNTNVQNNANEIQDTKQKLQNNAQKIQDLEVKLEGKRCESSFPGATAISGAPNGGVKYIPVTFQTPFKTTPVILVAAAQAYNWGPPPWRGAGFIMSAERVQTTGFTVRYRPLSQDNNVQLEAAWIACA